MSQLLLQPLSKPGFWSRLKVGRQVRRHFHSRYGRLLQRGQAQWLVHSPQAATDCWPWLEQNFAREPALLALLPVLDDWFLCAWHEAEMLVYCQLSTPLAPTFLRQLMERPDFVPVVVLCEEAARRWGDLLQPGASRIYQVTAEQLTFSPLPGLWAGVIAGWLPGVPWYWWAPMGLLGLAVLGWWWAASPAPAGEPLTAVEMNVPDPHSSQLSQVLPGAAGLRAQWQLLQPTRQLTGWELRTIRYRQGQFQLELTATYGLGSWLQQELSKGGGQLEFTGPTAASLFVQPDLRPGVLTSDAALVDWQRLQQTLYFWFPDIDQQMTPERLVLRLQHPMEELLALAQVLDRFPVALKFSELRLAQNQLLGQIELRGWHSHYKARERA